jgi:hypothetical protein
VQRRVEQVGAQLTFRAIDDPGPGRPADGVEHCSADDRQREKSDEHAGRVLGQPAGEDGSGGLADCRNGRCDQRPPGDRAAKPREGHPPRSIVGGLCGNGRGSAEVEEGHGLPTLRGGSDNVA